MAGRPWGWVGSTGKEALEALWTEGAKREYVLCTSSRISTPQMTRNFKRRTPKRRTLGLTRKDLLIGVGDG